MSDINRRRITRFPGEKRQVIIKSENRTFTATVSDFSVLGIAFVTEQQLLAGSSLVLLPKNPPKVPPPEIRIDVKHASKDGDHYVIGCSFSRMLQPGDVIAFDG